MFALLDRILTGSARRNGRDRSGGIVAMLLKKRFLSSPWSFALTLRQYTEAEPGRGLEVDDEDQYYQEVLGTGQSDEEEGDTAHPEFTALRHSKRSDPLSAATGEDISSLIAWGQRYENQPDARLTTLLEFLDTTCRPGGTWSNERVVVFTEYAATLDWIVRVLSQHGYRSNTLFSPRRRLVQLVFAPVAALGQDADDPLQRGGVLGEDDDPLVRPGAARPADGVEELDQRRQPGVGPVLVAAAPSRSGTAMSSLVAALSGSERLLCRSAVNSGCAASPSSSSDCPLPRTSW